MSGPRHCGIGHGHFNGRDRRNRPPKVFISWVKTELGIEGRIWNEPNTSSYFCRYRRCELVKIYAQLTLRPFQITGAHHKLAGCSEQCFVTAFGHRPCVFLFAVDRNVDRAMIEGVIGSPFSVPGVVRRKHAADESDDGQPFRAIFTQSIYVPPNVALIRYRDVEARS